MYEQIREEFKPLFVKANLDFDIAYNNAYNQHGYKPDVVRNVLQAILDNYYLSKATTKGGRIGRFLARIASIILPFIKIKK
jgi:hypothetical protein